MRNQHFKKIQVPILHATSTVQGCIVEIVFGEFTGVCSLPQKEHNDFTVIL